MTVRNFSVNLKVNYRRAGVLFSLKQAQSADMYHPKNPVTFLPNHCFPDFSQVSSWFVAIFAASVTIVVQSIQI